MSGLHKGEYLRCSSPFSYTFINFLCQKDAEGYGKRGFAALVDILCRKSRATRSLKGLSQELSCARDRSVLSNVQTQHYGPVGGFNHHLCSYIEVATNKDVNICVTVL